MNAEVKNLKKIIASGQFHMAEPQPDTVIAQPKTLPVSTPDHDSFVTKPDISWEKAEDDVDFQESETQDKNNLSIVQASEDLIRKAL